MSKKDDDFRKRFEGATCLQDLIVRKAPHNFPIHSLDTQEEAGRLNRKRIIQFLLEAPKEVIVTDIMKETGLSYPYVYRLLSELLEAGMVTKRAAGRRKLYKLI